MPCMPSEHHVANVHQGVYRTWLNLVVYVLRACIYICKEGDRERAYGCSQACWQVLAAADPAMVAVWLRDCRGSFSTMIADKQKREAVEAAEAGAAVAAQPDELIDFSHLKV